MLTATIQFSGAGGTTEAARQAGILGAVAINHSPCAMATHQANHPATLHLCQSMEVCNPDTLPESDFLLTSPCCTNHSVAKGQKQYHQFDLFGDIEYNPLAEKSRNTMEDVVRFATAKKHAGQPYKVMVLENVVDVVKWRKYPGWLTSLIALGYAYQALYWNTQFFQIPQSRDRVYLVFWLHDLPAPDLVYHPRAYCERCGCDVAASQTWKRLVKWGRYQEQYVYVCPQCTREVKPDTIPVETVLNLSVQGRTLRERRLTEKTLRNVASGIARMHGQPFLLGYYNTPLFRRLHEPVGTITTVDRWALITPGETFEDTRLRMLSVEEVKRAMGFPESYRLLGSTKEQVWMLGNAVCPPIMREILERCKAIVASVERWEVAACQSI